ncbi:MAG TPA: hypothetical protein VIY48_20595, partial [Candidatus Paceibacterota bacterium]
MAYFKDPSGGLHCLSAEDIANGGEKLLPLNSVAITDADALAIQNPTPTAAQLLAAFQQSARLALEATSVTMERITEAVSVGATSFTAADVVAWMNYRKALRTCVSATTVGTLPTKP